MTIRVFLPQKWDPALAELARQWADQCKWARGQPDDQKDLPYSSIGQNLYLLGSSPGTHGVMKAIAAWYNNERDRYNYDTEVCSGTCDNYTQVSRRRSNAVERVVTTRRLVRYGTMQWNV